MIETSCITIDKTRPVIFPQYNFYTECPEEKNANCNPVYLAERPKPGSPGQIEFVCFDGQFIRQSIPVGAECWCGNGFKGNPAYYWIWEECMANTCSYCPPADTISGFRTGFWRYPDCCVLPLGVAFGSYLNCDGTGGLHTGAGKLCCSPICQNIRGKTSQTLMKNYIIEKTVNNNTYATSYIDTSSSNCNYYCCSNSDKITYESDVVFEANTGMLTGSSDPLIDPNTGLPFTYGNIINPNTGEPLRVNISDLGPIRSCSQSINKRDILKVSINIGDRDDECASNAMTSMFMDSIGYLPPIKGCRVAIYFNFHNNENTRLIALLDTNSLNENPVFFDYYGDNDLGKDFKLVPNDTYDKNYPEIILSPSDPFFNSLIFKAGSYCKKSTLFKYEKPGDAINSYLYIEDMQVTYTFSLRNGELYMRPFLTFNMPNTFDRTADIFSEEEILISEISDFYKEISFLPRLQNNTNCRVQVSLYG